MSTANAARYIKPADSLGCSEEPRTFYNKKKLCGEDCIAVSKDYNCEYFVAEDEIDWEGKKTGRKLMKEHASKKANHAVAVKFKKDAKAVKDKPKKDSNKYFKNLDCKTLANKFEKNVCRILKK